MTRFPFATLSAALRLAVLCLPSPRLGSLRWPLLLAVPVLASGCVWVRLDDAGAAVLQGTADSVTACREIGEARAHTLDRMLFRRSRAKVQEELLVLASNEAATIGGDTIVPVGRPVDGRQTFKVYRCRS